MKYSCFYILFDCSVPQDRRFCTSKACEHQQRIQAASVTRWPIKGGQHCCHAWITDALCERRESVVWSSVGVTACSMTITTDMVYLFSKVLPKRLPTKLSSTKTLPVSRLHLLSGTGLITIGSMFLFCLLRAFSLVDEFSGCSKSISFRVAIRSHCCFMSDKGLDSGIFTVSSCLYYIMSSVV